MVDEETAEGETDRRDEMEAEREKEVEEEMERVDEEMDSEQTDQSDAAALPDDEEGDRDRVHGEHVGANEENDG
ncbi:MULTISPECIES: hypothetical protein [Halorussus]|uniref:hypothetical protein n=1 Tax=Halorussus TaxID=1070314 RepID=UPI000E21029B|nr:MULTISPECIES: hypothetical protein [Halorussus]NHN57939.1 hypothetical protein [Halorussus sp. JP-T4]